MLSELFQKVKQWLKDSKNDLFLAAVIFLTGIASFGLGRLSVIWPDKMPITFTESKPSSVSKPAEAQHDAGPVDTAKAAVLGAFKAEGKYVASKSGTAYHYPWCAGAQKIKESNRMWFDTKEAAEAKGYKPAANCPGL